MSKDREALMRFFKGDEDAVKLAFMLAQLSHIWDDLIDRDKPVSDDQINSAFWLALLEIPSNPFYQRFGNTLRPVMATAILNWHAANEFERRGELAGLEIANAIRYSAADVMMLMAVLTGGPEWGAKCAADIRLLCQKDRFVNYLKEQNNDQSS